MSRFVFDAATGVVYGPRGKPITKRLRDGYVVVFDRGVFVGMAHRLIWEHVYGQIPLGLQVNHINGVKWDNRIENLELVTPSENLKHAYRLGLASASGERNGRAKLTAEKARQIRESCLSSKKLAKQFSVSVRTVRAVRSGLTWVNA